jgi:hypothetical protein
VLALLSALLNLLAIYAVVHEARDRGCFCRRGGSVAAGMGGSAGGGSPILVQCSRSSGRSFTRCSPSSTSPCSRPRTVNRADAENLIRAGHGRLIAGMRSLQ